MGAYLDVECHGQSEFSLSNVLKDHPDLSILIDYQRHNGETTQVCRVYAPAYSTVGTGHTIAEAVADLMGSTTVKPNK